MQTKNLSISYDSLIDYFAMNICAKFENLKTFDSRGDIQSLVLNKFIEIIFVLLEQIKNAKTCNVTIHGNYKQHVSQY